MEPWRIIQIIGAVIVLTGVIAANIAAKSEKHGDELTAYAFITVAFGVIVLIASLTLH